MAAGADASGLHRTARAGYLANGMRQVGDRTGTGGHVMEGFWRFWGRLEMWQKFGLAFVAAVLIVLIAAWLF